MRLTTLFLLANLVTSSILPTGVMAESPWIRKNAADLTSAEWTLFKDAWSTVAANGFLQGLLDIHSLSSFDHHGYSDPNAPRFLPWHRVFLAVFEKELHDFNGTTIPYWDWNSYREGNLVGNPLVEHSSDPDWGIWNFPHDVSRGLFVSSLPSSAMYDTMYQRPVYWDGSLASSFATQLQSLHDSVHVYVGGNMGGISTAPSDPIYWMHHAFVDKTWFDWEQTHLQHSFNFSNGADAILGPWDTHAMDVQIPAVGGIVNSIEFFTGGTEIHPGYSYDAIPIPEPTTLLLALLALAAAPLRVRRG